MKKKFRLFWALLLFATLLFPQGKKSKKNPDFQIVVEKIEVTREGEVISLEGVVRNTGLKPIRGLELVFEFFAPRKESLTIRSGPVESAVIEPGDGAEFRLQTKAPTRAVELTIDARDRDRRVYNVEKPGPYAIDQ